MLKDKIKKIFKFRNSSDIEFEAQIFGTERNSISIVAGTTGEIEPNHVAFVLGYVLIELCNGSEIDIHKILDMARAQMREPQGGIN